MSLEAALLENTNVMRELIAALTAAGALQTAQASAAAHSSPAVQAVVKAQRAASTKDADAKKQDAAKAATAGSASDACGEPSASTPTSSSQELQPWAEKTAAKFAELKDAVPDLEYVRQAVLGINALIGRDQANAVLGRFGAEAVTEKKSGDTIIKRGLRESQYPEFFALCLEVLSGNVDATASMASE